MSHQNVSDQIIWSQTSVFNKKSVIFVPKRASYSFSKPYLFMFFNLASMRFRFASPLGIFIGLFVFSTVLSAQTPATWVCCRTVPTSKPVCDSLTAFRMMVRAAAPTTDTINDLALNKLCRSKISDDMLRRILDTLKLYPVANRIQFLRDIHGISNLPTARALNNTLSMSQFVDSLTTQQVRAWAWCLAARPLTSTTTTMRLDWRVLNSVAAAMNNIPVLNALFINGDDKYLKVLTTFRGDCNTCDTAITDPRNNLPTIAFYLDTLLAFTAKYALPTKATGFDIFLQQEASATWLTKPDGAYHLMRDLAKSSYPRASVLEFEGTISTRMPIPASGYQCAGCSYDLRMNNDTLVDYKSYGANTGFTASTISQFKQYLQYWAPNATNPRLAPIRSFQYVFNGDKLSESVAKQKFYNLIRADALTYFNINNAFFTRFTLISSPVTVVSALNVQTFMNEITNAHPIFDFVIIKP
jgi:hypothetical protein